MLGITTPDAIAFGMMVLAALAAWRGVSQGDAAKTRAVQSAPFVSIAGTIVEANQFGDYIKVLDKLAIAMNCHAAALDRQHDVKTTNALEDLANKIDEAMSDRRRR
ncbi:hypothetical protein LPW26_06170 [Rhodopseudomonas sp. HC1]|uniref:hypothetical protein n=1 Tax=Rhodopseudomonas infernalis TaxID=2897386 RepID=UPI001EE78769|nr:hypothetical protein [Rhodopseudomonas infernalis]MCG6204213.1 hypothetical protein [Rhodopseudomonas infernalis]